MPPPKNRNARRLAIPLVLALLGVIAILVGGLLLFRGTSRTVPANDARREAAPVDAAPDLQRDVGADERSSPPPMERATSLPASPPVAEHPDAPSVIRGVVLDATTALPLDAFEVLCSPAGAEQNLVDTMLGMESATGFASSSFVNASGRFEIAVRGTESQSVCAFARGYARSEPVTAMPGDDLEIRLDPAGTVRGRVVDPSTGNPVGGALVGWIDRQGQARTGPLERFERTDALGRFELGSVPFSARNVVAGREDLGDGLSKGFDLASDHAEREVVIELRRSGG